MVSTRLVSRVNYLLVFNTLDLNVDRQTVISILLCVSDVDVSVDCSFRRGMCLPKTTRGELDGSQQTSCRALVSNCSSRLEALLRTSVAHRK